MTQDQMPGASRTKLIAIAALFAALYILLSYVSSYIVGPQLRGVDAHFWRALLMAVLASRLRTRGGPTLMGLVSGFLLLGIPAPAAFLYLPASVLAGLVYDYALWSDYSQAVLKKSRAIPAAVLSGIAESITAMIGLFILGFPFETLLGRLDLIGLTGPIGILLYGLGKNVAMSALGAAVALLLLPKLQARRLTE